MSTVVNMFLTQVVKRNGIPFEISNPKPSKELLESLKEVEDYKNGKVQFIHFKDIKELFDFLDN